MHGIIFHISLRRTLYYYVPTEKEITNIDKDGNENVVIISYKVNFIDSARFMANSFSSLVNNLTKRIQKLNEAIAIVS